jgi:hypothetical protein
MHFARMTVVLLSLVTFGGCSAQTSGPSGGAPVNDAGPIDSFEGVVFKGTVNALAVDGQYVYWTDTFNAKLERAPVGGGTPETLIASGENGSPTSVVVDATDIYVGTDFDTQHLLLRVSKATKKVEVLAAENCQNIVGSSAFIFCSTESTSGVFRVKKEDVSRELVWSKEFDFRFAVQAADEMQFVALDNALAIAPHTTVDPTVVSLAQPGSALATRDGVAWVATFDEAAKMVALSRVVDGSLQSVATFSGEARGYITSLAIDATHVYYTTSGGTESAEVARIPIGGGASARIAEAREPLAITVDDTAVYWVGADVGEKPEHVIERRLKSKIATP